MGKSKGPLAVARRREKAAVRLAAYRARMADLRAAGACCGICRHRGERRMYSCALKADLVEMICDLHGEGGGIYSPTTADNVCPDFSETVSEEADRGL